MFFELLFSKPEIFISTIVIVMVSVIIHELSHGFVAMSQGDDTPKVSGHITANPLVHMGWAGIVFMCLFGIFWGSMPVDRSKFRNPFWGSILVSLAGPLSNLLLSLIFVFGIISTPYIKSFTGLSPEAIIRFMFTGAVLNLVLCFFNLLPIPPLDGFTVASEIVPPLKSLSKNPYLPLIFLVVIFNVPGFWKSVYSYAQLMVENAVIYLGSTFF